MRFSTGVNQNLGSADMELYWSTVVNIHMQIILSIIVLALAIGGMSLGVIFGRHPLNGSCGSENGCEICTGDHACQQKPIPI